MPKQVGNLFVKLGLVTDEFDKKMAETDRTLKRVGKNLEQSGLRLSAAIGAPLALIGAKSLTAYKNFDSAFTGVKKTVDGSAADFKVLEKGILDMSKRLPIAAVEIAKVAETAGQMGIKTPDILKFTEVMAMLGQTTNLSADVAAETLGKFATVTNLATEDFGRLGATLVDLGNNFNGTEAEIAAMAANLAGAGSIVGLSQAQILGFANSLVSVGIEAEKGGTAFSKVFREIQVATEMGGQSLDSFAGIAGKSGAEFTRIFRDDAGEAITLFLEGFGNIKEVGGSAIQTLDAIGLSEIRVSDTMLRTANAQGLVRKSITAANEAWQKQEALLKEMAVRNGSLEAQMTLMGNSFDVLKISIGKELAPQVLVLSEAMKYLSEVFDELPSPIKKFIIYFSEAIVVMTTGALAIGALTFALGTLGIATALPAVGIAAFGAALATALTYVYKWTQEGGFLLQDFLAVKIREWANVGIQAVYDFANLIGRSVTNLLNNYIGPATEALYNMMGKDWKFNPKPYKELEAKLIDVTKAQANYKGSLLAAELITKKSADEQVKQAKKTEDAYAKVIPKIPKMATEASKAAAAEAKKAEKAIEDLDKKLKRALDEDNLDFLKDNLGEALKAKNTQVANALKEEIKNATIKGLTEGYQESGGALTAAAQDKIEQLGKLDAQKIINQIETSTAEGLKKGTKDSFFSKDLPDFLSKSISNAIVNGFETGFDSDAIKSAGNSAAQFFATKFQDSFAKLFQDGGLNSENIGESLTNLGYAYGISTLTQNLSDNKKDTKGGIISGAVLGATYGSSFGPVGAVVGGVVGAGAGYLAGSTGKSNETGFVSRKETVNWIEDKINNFYLPFLKEQGNLILGDSRRFSKNTSGGWFTQGMRYLDEAAYRLGEGALGSDTRLGAAGYVNGERYDPVPGQIEGGDWADKYWNTFGEEGGKQFDALGTALSHFAGQTAEESAKIGVVLAENLNGNLDNARLLLQTMGISAADLETALLQVGLAGEKSWHEVEVSLQQIPALTGEGLAAVGDVIGAYDQLIASAGRGQTTLFALRNIAIEVGEKGGSSLEDLKNQLMAAGVSTEDADRLLQALGQRGIHNLEELRNASDRTLGGVAADLESLGIAWGENLNDKFEDSAEKLDKLDKKLQNLNKEVDLKINVKYNDEGGASPAVQNAMGNVFTSSGITKYAKGGIFNGPTYFRDMTGGLNLAGEAGAEGAFPLKRMRNGDLGINAAGMGGGASVTYNIDARGAQIGVADQIVAAMKVVHKQSVSDSISIMRDLSRRGA